MARAPVPGRCKTRLAKRIGDERAARLYEAMLRDTLEALEAAGFDRRVVMAAPEDDGVAALRAIAGAAWEVVEQRGADLGERLAGAFEALCAPPALVCLVDSDSPLVPWRALEAPLRACAASRQAVVGPCEDGGYYLVGMTRFERHLLTDIPWSTDRVLPTTRERAREADIPLMELPRSWDVDDVDDLERLAAELANGPERAPRTARLAEAFLGEPR